jgi:hypothetical protein
MDSVSISRFRRWIPFGIASVVIGLAVAVTLSTIAGSTSIARAPACAHGRVSHAKIPRVFSGGKERRTTPVIILACGTEPSRERFQIVAFGVGQSTCAAIDQPKRRETRIALCKPITIPWLTCQSKLLCLSPPGVVAVRTGIRTEVSGEVTPEANTVRIEYRQHGARRSMDAALGKIDGIILKKLHIEQTGGVFAAVLSGCVPARSIRVTVLDAHGHRVMTKKESSAFRQACPGEAAHSDSFKLILHP